MQAMFLNTRRALPVLALGLTIGCGGSNSNTLAPSAARTSAFPNNAGTPASFGQFGVNAMAGAADFGACLSGSSDRRCFSGSASGTAQLTSVSPATTPGAPTNLTSSTDPFLLTLAWIAPAAGDPIVTYVIEAGSTTGGSNLARFATGSAATTFSATGVPPGNYFIRIRGTNAAGLDGPPSNEVLYQVGVIRCLPTPPPSALTLIASGGGTVALTWGQPSGLVSSYIVEAGSASGLSNVANSDLGSRLTSLTATNVGPGIYFVRLRARNACSVSSPSNEIRVTMP